MKSNARLLNIGLPVQSSEVIPMFILLSAALLPTLHRYFGSIEFARTYLPELSASSASVFMFISAFIVFGMIPLALVVFLWKESPVNYGLRLGDWRLGLKANAVLFPVIAIMLLYPSSMTTEMTGFYPLDRTAGESVYMFLRHEIARVLFFYSAWEFFFRGFILFGLRKYVGDWLAICIQTIPSCLWHIGMPTGEIFASIAGGLLFGILAIRTGSILWPLLLHVLIGITLDLFIVIG
jgi:uncharacterized protein